MRSRPKYHATAEPKVPGAEPGPPSARASDAAIVVEGHALGSVRFYQASIALFLAGYATLSLLYCPQPLLPTLADAFTVGAASSSLAISVTTGCLAAAIVAAAGWSDRWGRKRVMVLSLFLSAALNVGSAFAPTWPLFLACRALEGLALGGVPAVAMTYLGEETRFDALGRAMGLYVGGTAVGGLAGRVVTGLVASATSWRVAMVLIGGMGIVAALGFAILLPPSRRFRPGGLRFVHQAAAFRGALRGRGLLGCYTLAFLLMGGFVAVYNFVGFRLEAPPYRLDAAREGAIFTLYLLGTVGSTLAGTLADRFGRVPVLRSGIAIMLAGIAVSLLAPLPAVVAGIALVTFGFFAAHAVASGAVGDLAGGAKGQAASLYLLSYYAGSSTLGTAAGWFWSGGGWPAVASFVAVPFLLAFAIAGGLERPRAA